MENFSYPELFEYAYVILSCDLSSQISLGHKFNMADNMMFSVLLTIISSLIAYLELSIALVHVNIVRQRIRDNFRESLVSKNTKKATRHSQPYKQRHFWTRPGRTSAWWDNFVNEVVVAEEWRENFRISRRNLLKLSELLQPYIEGKTTRMRCPVDVTKKVACTLYYLSDEGCFRKTANAFGLSCQVVSKIKREVWRAMILHLGSEYVKLPSTVAEMEDLVKYFYNNHGFPQCFGAIDCTHIVWFQKISVPPAPTEGFSQFDPPPHWIFHSRGLCVTAPTPLEFP